MRADCWVDQREDLLADRWVALKVAVWAVCLVDRWDDHSVGSSVCYSVVGSVVMMAELWVVLWDSSMVVNSVGW